MLNLWSLVLSLCLKSREEEIMRRKDEDDRVDKSELVRPWRSSSVDALRPLTVSTNRF